VNIRDAGKAVCSERGVLVPIADRGPIEAGSRWSRCPSVVGS
jgi:hypothetical protein